MLSRPRRVQVLLAMAISMIGTVATIVPALAGTVAGPWPR